MTVSLSDLTVLAGLLTATCALFAIAGWIANRLNLPNDHDHMQPTPPVHVRSINIGNCAGCPAENVPVAQHRAHPLLDLEPHCLNCISGAPEPAEVSV